VDNQAVGGSSGNSGINVPGPFVDYGFGGAIADTESSLTATNCTFSDNQALGGSNAFAAGKDIIGVGGAEGGAIYNEVGATATITGCTLNSNQALGGTGNSGSGPVALVGEGLGGGISAGYGGNLFGPTTFTVTGCTFAQDSATGGTNNSGTASVTALVGSGVGGIALYVGGTVNVTGSTFGNNQATGGTGNTAGGTAAFADLGAGGAIFNYLSSFNSSVYGNLGPSVVTVSDTLIDKNLAEGDGGGEGGGIANLLGTMTTVDNSRLSLNEANGGGVGAALGGGLYNDATSTLALTKALVTQNEADGLPGIGGGVYTQGTFTTDAHTQILFNIASTSDDNIGP
jgi:hypothetical protein